MGDLLATLTLINSIPPNEKRVIGICGEIHQDEHIISISVRNATDSISKYGLEDFPCSSF